MECCAIGVCLQTLPQQRKEPPIQIINGEHECVAGFGGSGPLFHFSSLIWCCAQNETINQGEREPSVLARVRCIWKRRRHRQKGLLRCRPCSQIYECVHTLFFAAAQHQIAAHESVQKIDSQRNIGFDLLSVSEPKLRETLEVRVPV